MAMLNSDNIRKVLSHTLEPVSIPSISYNSLYLQSSVLLSSSNGGVLSFATLLDSTNGNGDPHALNNLKMMGLLIRDKWSEDETAPEEQNTNSCYIYTIPKESDQDVDESQSTRIYTYEIEELHACVAQIPKSDLLLLFIADKQYPYGLLVMKMKNILLSLKSLYGYTLEK
ncbi:hypothetical protein Kpol_1065p46 [Vanderwaltozyma polyspora DSM 70294]|uniref:Trafficking protein particle complex subunit n=1 Tax=Vanderwaltozyma polyspora (strain ATCC 22028 / DSM 70294 / BCRC 21397 / CBS 2163 / NBRC 10782 / NRRL Y-8283 / UCD 57-17) TaxID=436907 RepID=A7TL66_VANPO|nr:uncharacterized protein Kpol_1065p46 [Vanderwaltozyma polyspora DSM 70294]EDO17029.1 hypothetical protein Kpol_1065p46 [Vanderwaltozyma polyspora DSM 70294]